MGNELDVIEIKERKMFSNLRNEKRFESTNFQNPLEKQKKPKSLNLGFQPIYKKLKTFSSQSTPVILPSPTWRNVWLLHKLSEFQKSISETWMACFT